MLSLLDRYVSRYFLAYFAAALLVFVTIFVAIDAMSLVVKLETSTRNILQYYGYYLPAIIYQMVPVACMVGTVFTIASMARNGELVAFFSMGYSLLRVSVPIMSWVAAIGLFTFLMGDQLLPSFAQKKNYVWYVEIKKQPGLYSTVKTNRIWYRADNILFNIKTLNTERAVAQGITLYYFDSSWSLMQMITAQRVNMRDTHWQLKKGVVTLFVEESSFPLTQTFENKEITMPKDLGDLKAAPKSTDSLSIDELSRFIKKNKEAGLDTLRYEVDYHAKFGFPFAALVMSLIGIPFSVFRQRAGSPFFSIGICIGLVFLYWILYSSGLTLGQYGVFPPVASVWAPNFIFIAFSLLMFWRLKR